MGIGNSNIHDTHQARDNATLQITGTFAPMKSRKAEKESGLLLSGTVTAWTENITRLCNSQHIIPQSNKKSIYGLCNDL